MTCSLNGFFDEDECEDGFNKAGIGRFHEGMKRRSPVLLPPEAQRSARHQLLCQVIYCYTTAAAGSFITSRAMTTGFSSEI